MLELRQIISDINVLQARNRQFKKRELLGEPLPLEYDRNEAKLEELYRRKSQLLVGVDSIEPQYTL